MSTLVIGPVLLCFLLIVGGASGSPVFLLIGLGIGLVVFGECLYAIIGLTPRTVEVRKDSIVLNWYVRKTTRIVPMSDIEYVVVNPPDPPQWRKRYVMGGCAKIAGGPTITFSREIGNAMRNAYLEKFGHYPPERSARAQMSRLLNRR